MRILPESFTLRGYDYKQLERTDRAAIYGQYFEGELIAYEVVRVVVKKARVVMGKEVEEGEYYPGDEAWGTHGFTCINIHHAMDTYEMLNNLPDNNKHQKR